MGNIRKWSQTATGNATIAGGASTINWAEGQLPSTVNNSARETLAQIRQQYTEDQWLWVESSATASVASQTTFKLTGNQTAYYTANRRWRLKSASTTRYGSIVSSSFTTETTVTVTVDSGSLSASHTLAAVSGIDSNHIPGNTYVTSASLVTALSTYITSNSVSVALSAYVTSSSLATALSPYITSNSVSAAIAAIPTVSAGTAVFLGSATVSDTTNTDITGIATTYSSFLIIYTFAAESPARNLQVALSSNNGSSYGTARVVATTGTAGAFSGGSFTISDVKNNGTSKTITKYGAGLNDVDTTPATSSATCTVTEAVVTGLVNALRFNHDSSTARSTVTVCGIV